MKKEFSKEDYEELNEFDEDDDEKDKDEPEDEEW